MKKKAWVSLVAVVLVLCCAVGGTLAWLTAKSDAVTNTFAPSGIDIKLEETTGEKYNMIPGYTISKNPKATVLAGSEKCYLFVKLVKSNNFDNFMTYDMADGWTQLTKDKDGNNITDLVFYRVVDGTQNQIGTAYSVLKNDQVTVRGTVTEKMMNDLTTETYPTLTITAYASQLYQSSGVTFTAAQAWANIA